MAIKHEHTAVANEIVASSYWNAAHTGTAEPAEHGNEAHSPDFFSESSEVDHDATTNTHNLTTDIDHTSINNIGTNTHVQIDAHIAAGSPHSAHAVKTTTDLVITVGSGGDYETMAEAVASLPDLIADNVTITILQGTTLTETITLSNKHATVSEKKIVIASERYYPTTTIIQPTADSATATTLRDVSVFTVDDLYNDCWVLIVDGTGTNNGFVKITDTIAASGDIVVASWPGTQPDNTSKYMIVGALVACGGTQNYGALIQSNTCTIELYGVGVEQAAQFGIVINFCTIGYVYYCAAYNCTRIGIDFGSCTAGRAHGCAAVACNTGNSIYWGGMRNSSTSNVWFSCCALSDNLRQGINIIYGGYATNSNSIGDNNGTWGTYAQFSGQCYITGTECSGSSGNHSNGVGDGSLVY